MDKPVGIVAALVAVACGPAAMPAQELLTTGTVLVYTTPDGSSREWLVEEASPNLSHGGRTGCMRVRYAAGGPAAGPEERLTCVAGDSLFRWTAATNLWQLARPIGPADSLDLPLRVGLARYLTAGRGVDTVGGVPVGVVVTSVLTIDTTGKVIRRLQERFAPGLGTATWGRFEVPDPASSSGWRVAQEFRLTGIRRPPAGP